MTYTPLTWANGAMPALNGANLNHIEAGIAAAQPAATLDTDVTTLDANADSAIRVQQDARQSSTYVAQFVADDTPAAPAAGESATYFVTAAVSWPSGLVWSTDPDGDVAPTITGTALVSLFTYGGTTRAVLGATYPALPDTTAPTWTATLTTGTPAQTSVVVAASAIATDNVAVTAYEVSVNSGSTWATIVPSGLNFTITGLTASTSYPAPQFRAKDAASNVSTPVLSAQAFTAAAAPADTTAPTVGTLAGSAETETSFTLTVSGAADETALHATPYDFSLDDGATWIGYQASAVYNATGLDPSTEYTCKHRVRDAALNVSTGTAIAVTTTTITTFTDIPNLNLWLKADAITGLSDGAAVSSWADSSGAGNTATQGTAGRQPVYKTAQLNGLPVVRFAGTDDALASGATAASAQTTIVFVAKRTSLYSIASSDNIQDSVRVGATNTDKFELTLASTVVATSAASVPAGFVVVTATLISGGAWVLRVGGVEISGTTAATVSGTATRIIGGEGYGFAGDLAELATWSRALSSSEIAGVEGYLSTKYAL